MLHVWQSIIL